MPKKASILPRWAKDRDLMLMAFLGALNIGSATTTIVGARQILPTPLSDIVGVSVQAALFLLLGGLMMGHAPLRKWLAITVFATLSVYTSFFCYSEQLAGEAADRAALDVALQSHAELVSTVYTPQRSRAETLEDESETLFGLAEKERAGGISGIRGRGPKADGYAEKGATKLLEAQTLRADLARTAPLFEGNLEGLTPQQVFEKDRAAWMAAPPAWKDGIPAPVRGDYVDAALDIPLLAPVTLVRRGDPGAIVSLSLAMLVDGMSILLGTAIEIRRRKLTIAKAAGFLAETILTVRLAVATVVDAWNRPLKVTRTRRKPATSSGKGGRGKDRKSPAVESGVSSPARTVHAPGSWGGHGVTVEAAPACPECGRIEA